MHSFISEIKAVILKYKLILSARIVAFKSSVKVAYRKLMGKPEPKKRGRPKKDSVMETIAVRLPYETILEIDNYF